MFEQLYDLSIVDEKMFFFSTENYDNRRLICYNLKTKKLESRPMPIAECISNISCGGGLIVCAPRWGNDYVIFDGDKITVQKYDEEIAKHLIHEGNVFLFCEGKMITLDKSGAYLKKVDFRGITSFGIATPYLILEKGDSVIIYNLKTDEKEVLCSKEGIGPMSPVFQDGFLLIPMSRGSLWVFELINENFEFRYKIPSHVGYHYVDVGYDNGLIYSLSDDLETYKYNIFNIFNARNGKKITQLKHLRPSTQGKFSKVHQGFIFENKKLWSKNGESQIDINPGQFIEL